jgi:hypothetical protein
MVCLRSARTVIEIGKAMTMTRKDITSIKIWTLNHHIFVSTVILVMDYCFNRDEPRAKERREEIMDCFQLLESNKQECTIATRGLSKLRHMLRKERADVESGSSRPSSAGAPAVAPSSHPAKEQAIAAQHPAPEAVQVAVLPQAHQYIQDMNFNSLSQDLMALHLINGKSGIIPLSEILILMLIWTRVNSKHCSIARRAVIRCSDQVSWRILTFMSWQLCIVKRSISNTEQ